MGKKKSIQQKSSSKYPALAGGKLFPWANFAPKSVFPLERGSRAGVVVDARGTPRLFVFDTAALLDVLSAIDEKLVGRLSTDDYYTKSANPAGWLIDELGSKLPVDDTYAGTLRDAIREAEEKGWVPLSKIEHELELA